MKSAYLLDFLILGTLIPSIILESLGYIALQCQKSLRGFCRLRTFPAADQNYGGYRDEKKSKTQNHSINTEYSDTDSFCSDRNVGKGSEAMRIRAHYEDYFRESLELDYLSRDRTLDQDTIQAMVDLMVDVCCSTRKSIRINREDMPIEVVKSRFMKLDAEHIKYALMTLANNTTRVKDMKQYMLAVLYNAPTTISSYYQNWVQHDMANGLI